MITITVVTLFTIAITWFIATKTDSTIEIAITKIRLTSWRWRWLWFWSPTLLVISVIPPTQNKKKVLRIRNYLSVVLVSRKDLRLFLFLSVDSIKSDLIPPFIPPGGDGDRVRRFALFERRTDAIRFTKIIFFTKILLLKIRMSVYANIAKVEISPWPLDLVTLWPKF